MLTGAIGYQEDPKNGDDIIRSRTTLSLRAWDMPRSERALLAYFSEIGEAEFPGQYILIAGEGNIYVGEAKDIFVRLKTHSSYPDQKITNWDRVIIINDGRPAAQSDFNDAIIRREVEHFLKQLLRANRKTVVSQSDQQILNANQRNVVERLKAEAFVLLSKKGLVSRMLESESEREILRDELERLFLKKGKKIEFLKNKVVTIAEKRAFLRPGSQKTRGWQITFRDVFKDQLEAGEDYLLVNRGPGLLVPLSEIQKLVVNPDWFNQNTIDVFVNFEENKVTIYYRGHTIDVTKYLL